MPEESALFFDHVKVEGKQQGSAGGAHHVLKRYFSKLR